MLTTLSLFCLPLCVYGCACALPWTFPPCPPLSLPRPRVLTHASHAQEHTHDSVEDARTALALFFKAIELQRAGTLDQTIATLYQIGRIAQFKV